jgi:hypothetical protein
MPSSRLLLQRNKEKFLAYKKTLECVHCGVADYRLIEFHHIGDKDKKVSSMVKDGYGWERIQREIDKCIPLCCNCHRIEHWDN